MTKYTLYVNSPNGNGSRTEVECPRKHCSGEILYNGNYFCNTCSWVLGHISRRDKELLKICLTGLRDCAIKAGDTSLVERCNFYLGKGKDI